MAWLFVIFSRRRPDPPALPLHKTSGYPTYTTSRRRCWIQKTRFHSLVNLWCPSHPLLPALTRTRVWTLITARCLWMPLKKTASWLGSKQFGFFFLLAIYSRPFSLNNRWPDEIVTLVLLIFGNFFCWQVIEQFGLCKHHSSAVNFIQVVLIVAFGHLSSKWLGYAKYGHLIWRWRWRWYASSLIYIRTSQWSCTVQYTKSKNHKLILI